jgi:hypothetical protein
MPKATSVFGEKRHFHYGEPGSESCATIALVENALAANGAHRFLSCVETCSMPHTTFHEICTGETAEEALSRCIERWDRYVQGRRGRIPLRA